MSAPRGRRPVLRRPLDLLAGVAALLVLAVLFGSIHLLPLGSREVSHGFARIAHAVPQWLSVALSLAALAASFAIVVLALTNLLRHQPRAALSASVAGACAGVGLLVTTVIWNAQHGELDRLVLHGSNPSILIYDGAFVAFLAGSELVHRRRWARWCVLSAAALLVFDFLARALAPFAVPIALLAGLACGWLVRFAIAPATLPAASELASELAALGVKLVEVREAGDGDGTRYRARQPDGTPVEVLIAGRESAGRGLWRRVWSVVRLRPTVSGRVVLGSRRRIEQLALAGFLAENAGVLAPRIVLLRELQGEAVALVITEVPGRRLQADEGAAGVAGLFKALRLLHDAGLAHRDLRPENLVIANDEAGFASLEAAQPRAGELLQRLDVAQLLVSVARCTSTTVALEGLRSGYRPVDEAAIAAVLQPLALAPWGLGQMRAARPCLVDLRERLAGPEIALPHIELERFRWRTVFSAVALIAAAFVLVGQLSQVNLAGALAHAQLGWFLVAVGASAVTYFAAAQNLAAFVPARLKPLRGFLVQLSTAYVGVAMPPTVGHVAVNSRYLHHEGVDDAAIAAAVALSQVVNVLTTVLLLLVLGLLTGSGVSHLHVAPSRTLLLALGAIALLAGALVALPATRRFVLRSVWPRVRAIGPRLWQALSNPGRLALSSGANLLLSASYVVAFVAAIRAVGGHPAILPAAVVYLTGNAVGSAAPTPGGVGAVETVLAAGLSAIGIPLHEAVPAVLIFRAATFWLPIPSGWAAYLVLQRRHVL